MAFVPGYEHDIFVSYAHVDDQLLPGADEGWVTTLVKGLKILLAQKLGRKEAYSLWWDPELAGNVRITSQIMDTLRKTATLLVILSPGYVASDWCQREKDAFSKIIKERVRSGSRVFIVERGKVEDGDRPPTFDDLRGYRFWVVDREDRPPRILGIPKPNPNDLRYYDLLNDLSHDLAEELRRLKAASALKEDVQHFAPASGTQREHAITESVPQLKIETGDFDVFLCHNNVDKPAVKKIAERLRENGILPWLDEWELRPGSPWQKVLEKQIAKIKSAAVFVGREGIGPWQRQELDALLREFVNRDCPVIPVLLPDAGQMPELPIFLRAITWVDFRRHDPDPLGQLIWGITGAHFRDTRRTVFLAEVTDDLDPVRDDVKRYLDQAGLRVVPDTLYPREATTFQQAVNRDLAKCELFIQLLSGVAGKRPPGSPQSYARLQYERAVEAGKPILQWRSPELDMTTIKEEDHRAFLELDSVLAIRIEQFKRGAVERAFHKPPPPPPKPAGAVVFVNAEKEDHSLAQAVVKVLDRNGLGYALPLRIGQPAEIRKELEQNLLDCDALIIVYGSITVKWVRDQLRYCHKIIHVREQPLHALAVYEGPPEPKDPLDFKLPNMHMINCRHGLSEAALQPFIGAVRAARNS